MKSRLLATWGFEFGTICLLLAAIFLILYFFFRHSGSGTGKNKKPIGWLMLSGSSYLLAFGGLIFIMIAYFQMYIPNMGDFSSVQLSGGDMTAGNGDGEFCVTNVTECFSSSDGKKYHQIGFSIKNSFEFPVTIQAVEAFSRIDEKEIGKYENSFALPFQMEPGSIRNMDVRAEVTDRMREHAKKESKKDYGLTAYLTVTSSEGKLPGIPIRFPEQTCK